MKQCAKVRVSSKRGITIFSVGKLEAPDAAGYKIQYKVSSKKGITVFGSGTLEAPAEAVCKR